MDFSSVENGLYLGSRRGLQDFLFSHSSPDTHVLTVESENLSQMPQGVSRHKFIQVDDVKTADLMSHFGDIVSFIQMGLPKGDVYVHCRHGISRSAAACAAYLMAEHGLSAGDAVSRLRQCRPCVSPNAGFLRQLELFGRLGCRVSLEQAEFRRYRLRCAARTAAQDITQLESLAAPLLLPDDGLVNQCPPAAMYRCRQCRTALFSDRSVLHDRQDKTGLTSGSLRLLPLPWMTAVLRLPAGRLCCPRCAGKLGSFSWLPHDSLPAPEEEFEPSFLITRSRVDRCPPRLPPSACGQQGHRSERARTTSEDAVTR